MFRCRKEVPSLFQKNKVRGIRQTKWPPLEHRNSMLPHRIKGEKLFLLVLVNKNCILFLTYVLGGNLVFLCPDGDSFVLSVPMGFTLTKKFLLSQEKIVCSHLVLFCSILGCLFLNLYFFEQKRYKIYIQADSIYLY